MNTKARSFLLMAAAMAMSAQSNFGLEPIPKAQKQPDKICLLPGCDKIRYGNYLYCCSEHCKEHKAIKKSERKYKRS